MSTTRFIAQLTCGTHHKVYVSHNDDTNQLHLFKYNDHCCDYLITDDQDAASDFIGTPMRGFMWIEVAGDEDPFHSPKFLPRR